MCTVLVLSACQTFSLQTTSSCALVCPSRVSPACSCMLLYAICKHVYVHCMPTLLSATPYVLPVKAQGYSCSRAVKVVLQDVLMQG